MAPTDCPERTTMAENVYETDRSLEIYMLFHYGPKEKTMNWDFGPKDGLEFPARCAESCRKHWNRSGNSSKSPTRALDIGCAVGRSTFELSRTFDHCIGIDYSHKFVDAANELQKKGWKEYLWLDHGEITETLTAKVDSDIDRRKVSFEQGDACALRDDLGRFDLILAANLICRLERPRDFLVRMGDMVLPGGILVITSPYSFKTEFTRKENLVGGFIQADGTKLTGFQGLKNILEPKFTLLEETNMPFSTKETARFHQWTVSHATVWRRN